MDEFEEDKATTKEHQDSSFKESPLSLKVKKTADSRFSASRRMEHHSRFSQWTIIIISVSLIYISSVDMLFDLRLFTSRVIGVIQITASAFVLAYSVLLSMSKFDVRARDFYRSGIEFSTLQKKIDLGLVSEKSVTVLRDYDDIHNRYENHGVIDFEMNKIDRYKDEYKYSTGQVLRVRVSYLAHFAHYIITITLSIIVVLGVTFIIYDIGKSNNFNENETTPKGITTR